MGLEPLHGTLKRVKRACSAVTDVWGLNQKQSAGFYLLLASPSFPVLGVGLSLLKMLQMLLRYQRALTKRHFDGLHVGELETHGCHFLHNTQGSGIEVGRAGPRAAGQPGVSTSRPQKQGECDRPETDNGRQRLSLMIFGNSETFCNQPTNIRYFGAAGIVMHKSATSREPHRGNAGGGSRRGACPCASAERVLL